MLLQRSLPNEGKLSAGRAFQITGRNPYRQTDLESISYFHQQYRLFYYPFTTSEGTRYYYVNPEKREHRLLFDNKELLSKIAAYTHQAYDDKQPGLYFEFLKDNQTIELSVGSDEFLYNIFTKS